MAHPRLAKENVQWVARLTRDPDERLRHLEEMAGRHRHERIYETRAASSGDPCREYLHYLRVLKRYRALLEARDPPGLAAARVAFRREVGPIGYGTAIDYLTRVHCAFEEVSARARASPPEDRHKIERWREETELSPDLLALALEEGESGRQAAAQVGARLERLSRFLMPEAIAEILLEEDYLFRIRRNMDLEAWDPFLKKLFGDLSNLLIYADYTYEVWKRLGDLMTRLDRCR